MRGPAIAAGAALALALVCLGGTAAAAPPAAPTITEPVEDGQLVNAADVHMEATGFSDPDGDTHKCTDWEIRSVALGEVVWQAPCATGVDSIHIHLGDGSFVGSYQGRTRLHYSSDYTLRVRFRDSAEPEEISAWSQRSFRTYPAPPPGGPIAWSPVQEGFVVEEFAGDLQLPVNIAFIPDAGTEPDDPFLYVTELFGTIKVVTRSGQVSDYATGLVNFDSATFPGAAGEQGLMGIAVEPATGDVLASLVYESSEAGNPHYPKVVRFHSTDGGMTAADPQTVLDMAGEFQPGSHVISNLTFGPDGKLYVHMGDGFDYTTAQDLGSFRGKILRVNLDGTAPPDNPRYDDSDGINARDYIFSFGHRNPFGGAWRAANSMHYAVENGPSIDRLERIDADTNYLWDGTNDSIRNNALHVWDPSHAPVNIAFVQPETFSGSGFPASKQDHAFVSEYDGAWSSGPQPCGKRVVEFAPDPVTGELGGHPRTLVEYTGRGKATAAGLAAGPDGLYFTELFKDLGSTSATERGARIMRVRADASAPPVSAGSLASFCGVAATSPRPPVFPAAPRPPAMPSNDFDLAKVKRNTKKGIAFLLVNVPGPGDVGLSGPGLDEEPVAGIAAARKSLAVSGGLVKLMVKPAKKGRRARKIRRSLRRRGKARVKAVVTFVPTGGTANTQATKVTLIRK